MRNWLKRTIHTSYSFIIDLIRKFIFLLHKLTSNLRLKDVVLFGSTPDLSDSAAEVFNLMITMDEFRHYKFVWFCDNPKLQRKKQREKNRTNVIIKKRIDNPLFRLVNLYCESTARYCVYTHEMVGNMYNERQTRVYIEHGSFGIKRLKLEGKHNHTDYASYRIGTFKSKNNLNNPKKQALGLPRNDRLFDDPSTTKIKLNIDKYNKVIVWMPTFKHYRFRSRFHLQRNDYQIHKEYDITLQEDKTFYDEVDKTLTDHNVLLLIKYHPSQDMRYVVTKETSNVKIITDEDLSARGISLYTFLGSTDALITDFSSVCYDYLLIDKPIGFDITDLDLYQKGGTTAIKDPLRFMPGEKITSTREFCDFITHVSNNKDDYEEDRKIMLEKVHVYKDNQSSKRVIDLILSNRVS